MGVPETTFGQGGFGVIVHVFFEPSSYLLVNVGCARFWKVGGFAEEVAVEVEGWKGVGGHDGNGVI